VADTWRAAFIATVQVSPVALSQPLQATDWSAVWVAVSVTTVAPA
jgi:hypothetical protein